MSKRPNGQGSIGTKQRTDGRWQGSFTLPNGKRKFVYAKTRVEVGQKITKLLKDSDKGKVIADERITLEKYTQGWLEIARGRLKPSTWHRYELDIRRRILPALGKKRLAHLEQEDVKKLYSQCTLSGLSAGSVINMHRVLSAILNEAVTDEKISRNVASLAVKSLPRRVKKEMQVLSKEQAGRLLTTARGTRFEALYELALSTGMRQGECLGTKWQDIDWDAGTIQVRRTLSNTKDGLKLVDTKTVRSRRMIKLTATTLESLRRHKISQNEERLSLGAAWQDNDLIFCTEVGTFIHRGNLERRSFKPLLAKAGLPNIRFHDLRHTTATLMLAAGLHPKVVADTLGHSSIAITLDLYSHVTPSLQAQAAEVMDAILAV